MLLDCGACATEGTYAKVQFAQNALPWINISTSKTKDEGESGEGGESVDEDDGWSWNWGGSDGVGLD